MADASRYEALADKYRASLPDKANRLVTLRDAATGGDGGATAELAGALHQLAGSAAVYGLGDLSSALAIAEGRVRGAEGDVAAIEAAVEDVLAAFTDAS